ncbi:hypothetical protein XH93_08155 [Bradyrhizobium sp. CCBAU 51753]|nr:hypothetical protein XH93_08155 [Bradyrhizobium sp. CCBAU 51753]
MVERLMRLDNPESARTALGTQPMQGGPARPKTSFSGEAVATELVESMLAMLWGAQLVEAAFLWHYEGYAGDALFLD